MDSAAYLWNWLGRLILFILFWVFIVFTLWLIRKAMGVWDFIREVYNELQ